MFDSVCVLVFCRLLGFFMVAPVWGQSEIPPTVKGSVIFALSCVVAPFVPAYEADFSSVASWVIPMSVEVGVGFFFGLIARLILVVLDMLGNIMSFQMGLSFATVMNPAMQSQTTLPSHILMQCGLVIMLCANMHHVFLKGLLDSYHMTLSFSDGGKHLIQTMNLFFSSALRLSMPFLVLHVFLQVIMGFLNRFVPTLSFFAISLPAQLLGGLIVLLATVAAILFEFPSFAEAMWYHR